MADIIGNSQLLTGGPGDGEISTSNSGTVFGVCVRSALTGTLTITGMTQSSGAAQAWAIAPGTSGYVAPPGSTKFFGALRYSLSNAAADAGKAFVAYQPT